MKNLWFMLVFSVLMMIQLTYSQEHTLSEITLTENPVYIPFDAIEIKDGLEQQPIPALFQDKFGYLWIGGEFSGLIRFDGYQYKLFTHQPGEDNTLSGNLVSGINEDHDNRLWITTLKNGINFLERKNGKFHHFSVLPDSLMDKIEDSGRSVVIDETGAAWIGTFYGILRITFPDKTAPEKPVIERFLPVPGNSLSLRNRIISLLIDRKQRLWMGTADGLGYIASGPAATLKPANSSYRFLTGKADLPENYLSGSHITSITEDRLGNIWAGAGQFLLKINLDKAGEKIIHYFMGEKPSSLYRITRLDFGSAISEINIGGEWAIWSCGYSIGANIFSPHKETIQPYLINAENPPGVSIPHSGSSLYQDNDGLIWLGSINGLYKYDPYINRFNNAHPALQKIATASARNVRSVFEDSRGDIWITQESVYRCDAKTGKVLQTFWSMAPNWVFQNKILEDKNGHIWLAPEYGNISRWDAATKQMREVTLPETSKALSDILNFTALTIDHQNHVWVASVNRFDGNRGDTIHFQLHEFSGEDGTFIKSYKLAELSLIRYGFIMDIAEGRRHELWMATSHGLIMYHTKTGELHLYQQEKAGPGGSTHATLMSICPDPVQPDRFFWLGSNGGGLYRFDTAEETFLNYTAKNGLSSNTVNAILADAQGDLWAGTDRGIVNLKLNAEDRTLKKVVRYTKNSGLEGNNFTYFYGQNAHKTAGGELIFTRPDGFNKFDPNLIRPNPPRLQIDSLSINHKPVYPATEGSSLDSAIYMKNNLQLAYDQNTLALQMTALSFHASAQSRYRYRMDGIDEDWIENGRNRVAHYTELAPGTYTFRAMAANGDGIWNESEKRLRIIVYPPWWRTIWAYLFYGIAFVAMILGIFRIRERTLLSQKAELEKAVRERTETVQEQAEELKELDRLKTRFFANISHEFRTPLTLIMGPLDQVEAEVKAPQLKKKLNMMKHNTQRLYQLINQLLDFSRLESKRFPLQAAPGDIVAFTKMLGMGFASWADRKKISFQIIAKEAEVQLYFDRDQVEKMINNLLSNALKFTPNGGKVQVRIEQHVQDLSQNAQFPAIAGQVGKGEGVLVISVMDTGIGIPEDRLPHIFDRFYQADSESTREYEGSGIGLALTKELIERHYGTIQVESRKGKGTTFHLCFPLGMSHFADDEIVASVTVAKQVSPIFQNAWEKSLDSEENGPLLDESPIATVDSTLQQSANVLQGQSDKSHSAENQAIVLIVEDHRDFRVYIKDCLKKSAIPFKMLEACNGQEGIEKALEVIPDLIISDVMMPKMNGYQLCEAVKLNEKTSHIPIILLTAKAGKDDKLQGLKTGADDYLNKPFDTRELLTRVENLIEQRRKLQIRYREQIVLGPEEIEVTSTEKNFLKNILSVIEKNMADESFSLDSLVKEAGISRTHLNRKLNALTGQSPNQLIQGIRLKRAAELLRKNAGNISEIAYMTGFNSQSYFTKTFQKQYGMSPMKYKKLNRER